MAGPPIAYPIRRPSKGRQPDGAHDTAAVVVVHGIGQQEQHATLADAVAGLSREMGGGTGVQMRKVRVDGDELTCAEMETRAKGGGTEQVHVYEAYWAPLAVGKAGLGACVTFLLRAGLRGIRRSLPGRFRRQLFNQDVKPPHAESFGRAILFLFILAVLASLLVLNATMTAVVGTLVTRRATALSNGSWPGPTLLENLTEALAIFLGAVALFWAFLALTQWQVRRLRRDPRSGLPPAKAPAGVRALSVAGFAMFCLTLAALVVSAVLFVFHLTVAEMPAAVEVGADAVQGSLAPVAEPVSREVFLMALAWLALGAVSMHVRRVIVDYVGDVVVYVGTPGPSRTGEASREIRESVVRTLRRIYSARAPDGRYRYGRIAVVGHSLGSVVAYDALNRLILEDLAEKEGGRVIDRTRLLLTFGSPLDKVAFLFGFQGGGVRRLVEMSEKPLILSYEHRRFPWVNIHAPTDIVSASLDLYDALEDAPMDRRVRNEVDPLALSPLASHNEYWGNRLVWRRVRDALLAEPMGTARIEVAPVTAPRMMA